METLVRRGESDIAIIDDLSSGRRENIAALMGTGKVRLTVGNILDYDALEPLIENSSRVFHLAAMVGVANVCNDPRATLQINIDGTQNVLELCAKHDVPLTMASTSEAYGKSQDLPLSENSDTTLGPTSVKRWSYAISKLADEHLAFALMDSLPITVLRFFNTYGPRMNPSGAYGVVARFARQALTGDPLTVYSDGEQTRSFTYIDDTIDGVIGAAESGVSGIFNIGISRETTINDLAAQIIWLTRSRSPIIRQPYPTELGKFEETRRRIPDVTKALKTFGFAPHVDLRAGLQETIAWLRSELIDLREEAV